MIDWFEIEDDKETKLDNLEKINKNQSYDLNYIISIIQNILNKSHTHPDKKTLSVRPNFSNPKQITFACPICGDSHISPKKHRCHLYLQNFYVKCYNDDSCSRSFSNFCKYFNIELDIEKKIQIYNYLEKNWKYEKKEDFAITNMNKLIDINEFVEYMNKLKKPLSNLSPIVEDSLFHKYLLNRKIYNYENIYQASYHVTDKWIEPVIVILNRTYDKILGMQIRNLKIQKDKRIYKFFTFQELYNMMNPDSPLDEFEAIPYNKMSAIFNFLNVDYDSTIYVFEGYLDSVFFPNSISLVGLDTDISLLSNENLDLKFVLDADISGQKKSKEMIDNGYSVFLWKKLFNDLSKGKGFKYKSFLENNIKDINKLAEYYDNNHIYNDLKLNNYFAKDKFDLIDM